ncbi:hypothetical protein D3C87_2148310 [compost metagenome]
MLKAEAAAGITRAHREFINPVALTTRKVGIIPPENSMVNRIINSSGRLPLKLPLEHT